MGIALHYFLNTLFICFLCIYLCVYGHECMWCDAPVHISGQLPGVSSLLLLSWFQGSNSCHWAWCQGAFTAVLVRVFIFVSKHHDHEQLGLFCLCFFITVKCMSYYIYIIMSLREVKARTQERNLEAGTVREECCLMACSCDLLSLLLLYFRTICLVRGSIDLHGLGPPTLIIHQEDAR